MKNDFVFPSCKEDLKEEEHLGLSYYLDLPFVLFGP